MTNHNEYHRKLSKLQCLIAKTPLLQIKYKYKNEERIIYAKSEYYNYTGSIKDRMAYYILKNAYKSGELKPGMRIVEATSGNTGISFAALARYLAHDVTIFIPNWMSQERISLLKSFGAEIYLVSKGDGGFLKCIALANEMKVIDPKNIFLPLQFENEMNIMAHYLGTGPEIYDQINVFDVEANAFVAGVGTGGTIMGVGRFLKKTFPKVKIFPIEPLSSPTLSKGTKSGSHRIQGISDDFIPSILKLDELDGIIQVDDGDAIVMSQNFSRNFGLGVGISSGANFLGAVELQNRYGKNFNVITVFPDDNKKYLSTDFAKTEPLKSNFLTNNIKLIDLQAIPS